MIERNSQIVAVIPARGGSKEIPGKNLRLVGHKPLIVWTLEAVKLASTTIRLVVTTDSPQIADVSSGFGAEVVMRPSELARDDSPTEPAVVHALDSLKVSGAATVMLLQATSPIRERGSLDEALKVFKETNADSLVGVVPVSPFLWKRTSLGADPLYGVGNRRRRQEMSVEDQLYVESGALYLCYATGLREHMNRIHGKVEMYAGSRLEGIEVDTREDLELVDQILAGLSF